MLAGFLLVIFLAVSIAGAIIFTTVPDRNLPPVTPAEFGLKYSEISFPAAEDNVVIRGWFIPGRKQQVILGLHGKDTNRVQLLGPTAGLAQQGYNVLLIDLRGHGKSDGAHHTFGHLEQHDVMGAVAYLKGRGFKPEKIGIYGLSLGAVSGLLALPRLPEIKAMVADSAFANLQEELEYGLPHITGGFLPGFLVPGMLTVGQFWRGMSAANSNPEQAVKSLTGRQLLLIHCQADDFIPVTHFHKLKAAAGSSAESWLIASRVHGGGFMANEQLYVEKLRTFFNKVI